MKKDLAILIIVVTAALAFMLGYSLAPTGGGERSAGPAAAPGYGDEAPAAKSGKPGKAGGSSAPGYGDEAAPAKSPRKAAAPGYND